MKTRVAFLCLAVCVWTVTLAQHDTCTALTNCIHGFVDDRIELGLEMQLDPDTAQRPAPPVAPLPPGGASGTPHFTIDDLLRMRDKYHATLRPSVARTRAAAQHMLQYYTVRFVGVHKTPQQLRDISADFLTLKGVVKRAAPVSSAQPPNDPFVGDDAVDRYPPDTASCGTQWYLYATGVNAAWQLGAKGGNVVVADLDWGFDMSHSELSGAWDASHVYDMCGGTSAQGFAYHGTGVAGLIAARNDTVGLQGIAYKAKIWPVTASCATDVYRPCDATWNEGNPWADGISKVISEPCDHCRKVLLLETQTCCKGNYESGIAMYGWITQAIASNIVVVIAAGNGCRDAGLNDDNQPFEATTAIVVGATDYPDDPTAAPVLRNGSNFGTRVNVSAPGPRDYDLTITTSDHSSCQVQGNGSLYTEEFGGTSGAAAKVAGVVALMLDKNNTLCSADVATILASNPVKVNNVDSSKSGGAFLDAAIAVNAAATAGVKQCPPLP